MKNFASDLRDSEKEAEIKTRIQNAKRKEDLLDIKIEDFGHDIQQLFERKVEEIVIKEREEEQVKAREVQDSAAKVPNIFDFNDDEEEEEKDIEEDHSTIGTIFSGMVQNVIDAILPKTETEIEIEDINPTQAEEKFEDRMVIYDNVISGISEELVQYDPEFAKSQTTPPSVEVVEFDKDFAAEQMQNMSKIYYRDQPENRDLFSAEGEIRENESFLSIAGLKVDASEQDVRKAYFRLARQYHPDRNLDKQNVQSVFQNFKDAYDSYMLGGESERALKEVSWNSAQTDEYKNHSAQKESPLLLIKDVEPEVDTSQLNSKPGSASSAKGNMGYGAKNVALQLDDGISDYDVTSIVNDLRKSGVKADGDADASKIERVDTQRSQGNSGNARSS